MILSELLKMEGYYIDISYDDENSLDNIMWGIYDLVILDVMLPIIDGIQVLSEIRKNNINMQLFLLCI